MRDYIITTDSTADLPLEYIDKNNVKYLGLNYRLEDKEYSFRDSISLKEYYNKMRDGAKTTTMQANIAETRELFESIIKDGKDILHISFSSELSGSFNTESIVANELMDEYPDANICIIDSKAASGGQGIAVRHAVICKEKGYTLDEAKNYLNDLIPRITHYFTVEDMVYLYRGGRVSKTKAFIANVVNIKPILHCNEEGKLVPVTTARGRKKSIKEICKLMKANLSENYKDDNPFIVICDADARDEAMELGRYIAEETGIKDIIYNEIGATIGAHSGPGTIALFYVGRNR